MKYPRTYHAPFSPCAPTESDAKNLTKEELSSFVGEVNYELPEWFQLEYKEACK